MELKFAFVGFGNVARAFTRLLSRRRDELKREFGLSWKTTAIATANHGCVLSDVDLDLDHACEIVESGASLSDLPAAIPEPNSMSAIERCGADVLFETTPLDATRGEPGIAHVRMALTRGINVVTANKGPLAFSYRELKRLARGCGVDFRFEGAVMDGTPVFNLVERCLPAVKITGFSGVLNSTTNLILTGMEEGRSFEECVADAQRAGIAEANVDYDIDGWDAAIKAVALANVLMDADARPSDVELSGIRGIGPDELKLAATRQSVIRLIARGTASKEGLRLSIGPETVPASSLLGSVRGAANVLVLETDLMGELAIVETNPGIGQTAYALLTDLLAIHKRIKSV
jgi:homoserine dehydrogenase